MHDARLAAVLIGLSVSLVNCGAPRPEPSLRPEIKTVEIIPANVSVQSGTLLLLESVIKDAAGTVLSDARTDSVLWQTSQFAAAQQIMGRVTTIAASGVPPSTINVTASIGDAIGNATVSVTAPPTSSPPTPSALLIDWVRAPPVLTAAHPGWPTFALVDNLQNGPQRSAALFAFTELTGVGDVDCNGNPCGEVTVFSPMLGIKRDTVRWAKGCDFADLIQGSIAPCASPLLGSALSPVGQRVHVPVVIWQASSFADANSKIAGDVAYAKSVFDDPWTGFQIDFTIQIASQATEYLKSLGSCQNPIPDYDYSTQLPGIPAEEIKPDRITVAYVDDTEVMSAYACPYDSNEGVLIVISHSGSGGSSLAHEIGHALIQWNGLDNTHTDGFDGFDKSNLMYSTETADPGIRKHLTLGQLFQISVRDKSFLKQSGISSGVGIWCPPPPGNDVPCPRYGRDGIR